MSGVTESLTYDTDDETSAKESEIKINPAGFLKWVTGQGRKHLNIGNFKIIQPRLFDKEPIAQAMFSSFSCMFKGDSVTGKPHETI